MVTERRVRGAGLSLFVTERGDPAGPTVVLLHGFPDTSAVWGPVAARLAADLHVVCYDVRGAGRSEVPDAQRGYALARLVDDLAAVVEETSPDAPVHLVGHDWGSVQGWEAVTTSSMAGRLASFTSISGPPLAHAALWARRHRSLRAADLRVVVPQALRSSYIAFFHLPLLPELMTRNRLAARLLAEGLHRVEGVPTDGQWPAPTFGADFSHGVDLYRANMLRHMHRPVAGHTDVPVQLVVPTRDHYVTPALLDGLEQWASLMWRRPVDGGHWVVRTNPDLVARSVREVVAYAEHGVESDDLRRLRSTGTRSVTPPSA